MKNKRFLSVLLAVVVIVTTLSAFLCLPPMTAEALGNIYYVTNANNSGTGSLRTAITSAGIGDVIFFNVANFPPDRVTTITLTSALPSVVGGVVIQGYLQTSGANTGKPAISIARSTATGTPNFRILNALNGIALVGLEIKNGKSGTDGGGVHADNGSVTVQNCTFTNNAADYGGALWARSTVTLTNCTFTNNTSATYGGAVRAIDTSVTATNCTFTGNTALEGGGVNAGTSVTVKNCTFTGNTATKGGGVYAKTVATAEGCIFENNTATDYGGGMYAGSTANVTDSTFIGNKATNYGGGVRTIDFFNAKSATFANNTARYGSGVYADAAVAATNCMFTGNTTTSGFSGAAYGRGIYLYHSTVTKNTGNGVYVWTSDINVIPSFYAYNSAITGNSGAEALYGTWSTESKPYNITFGGSSLIEGIGGVTHAAVFGANVPDKAGIIKPLGGGLADKRATALTAAGIGVPSSITASSIIAVLNKDRMGTVRGSAGPVNFGAVESVSIPVVSVTLGNTVANMVVGNTRTLTVSVTPTNATNKAITWSSSDAKIAKVDQTGKVTAVSAGKVTIKATAKDGSGKSGSVAITVHQYVTMRVGKTTAIQNGKKTTIDDVGTKPFKISGKTMLPLRFVGEKMGGKVTYISDTQPIIMSYGDTKVEFRLGNKQMKVIKGSTTTIIILDVAAQKKSGKTYVPLRAISQALGFQVYYEAGTEYIVVNNPQMTDAIRNERLAEARNVIK